LRPALSALGAVLVLAGPGCTLHHPTWEEQAMVFAGARPLAYGGRSGLEGNLELKDDVGFEVAGSIPFFASEMVLAFARVPMTHDQSGEEVDLHWLDIIGSGRVRFTEQDLGSPLYARLGFGLSFLFMDMEDGHDMGGVGVTGRLGLGSCIGEYVGVEVFGDAHGWVGGDAEDFRAAWVTGLGLLVFVAF
jgi:hypothetical protein